MNGSVTVRGSVAYANQEAWVFSATLRENILFGLPYQPGWYSTVVEACALERVMTIIHVLRTNLRTPAIIIGYRALAQWRPDPGGGERGHSQWGTKG